MTLACEQVKGTRLQCSQDAAECSLSMYQPDVVGRHDQPDEIPGFGFYVGHYVGAEGFCCYARHPPHSQVLVKSAKKVQPRRGP